MENKFRDWKKTMGDFVGKDFWHDFQEFFVKDWPLVNIYETPETLTCVIAVPGIQKENFHLFVNHQSLTLKGDIPQLVDEKIAREEFSTGSFVRKVQLPYPVHQKPEQVTYDKGFLLVLLNRIQESEVSEIFLPDTED